MGSRRASFGRRDERCSRAAPRRLYRRDDAGPDRRCSTKAFSCTARTSTWGCARAGPDGSAATWPGAVVEHRYSHSAGRASALKAYYVERNRLYTIVKNFPCACCCARRSPRCARYFWHLISLLHGTRESGRIPRRRPLGGAAAVSGAARACRGAVAIAAAAAGTADDLGRAADHARTNSSELLERHSISVARRWPTCCERPRSA